MSDEASKKTLVDQLLNMYGYELYRLSLLIVYFVVILIIIMLKGMTSSDEKERSNFDSFDSRLGILDSDLNLHLRMGDNADTTTDVTQTDSEMQTQTDKGGI